MTLSILDKFHLWRRRIRWNRQYKKGKWNYLNNDIEAPRYSKIIDYIKHYGDEKGNILDLGAGEGVLNEYLKDIEYNYFLGVDYSKVSINKAQDKKLANTEFMVADLHYFEPKGMFDIIIFNEAFYYIHDIVKATALKKMLKHLKPNGLLIVSIFKEGIGCWEHFNLKHLQLLNKETINTTKEGTYWKVAAYKKTD